MSHEHTTMEMKALQAAGWVLAAMKEKTRFNTDCSTSKCLVYVFAHSATGRVMLIEVPMTNEGFDAEVEASKRAFKLLFKA